MINFLEFLSILWVPLATVLHDAKNMTTEKQHSPSRLGGNVWFLMEASLLIGC